MHAMIHAGYYMVNVCAYAMLQAGYCMVIVCASACVEYHPVQMHKVRKRAKIRNRYNQAPHLTQDTNEKVTTSQLDITNKSQEVNPFPAGDHKALTNRRA